MPAASRIPGAPRDGFAEFPTAPVITAVSGPAEHEPLEWTETVAPAPRTRRPRIAAWALALALVALVGSLFVGLLLPLGVIAIIVAIVALMRRGEPKGVAISALALGVLASLYSAGWLLWAGSVAGWF